MWSDPEEIDTWAVSPRGAGWLFGGKVCYLIRRVSYLIRSAFCVRVLVKEFTPGRVSAPMLVPTSS